jgi:flagellar motor switch protein FliG
MESDYEETFELLNINKVINITNNAARLKNAHSKEWKGIVPQLNKLINKAAENGYNSVKYQLDKTLSEDYIDYFMEQITSQGYDYTFVHEDDILTISW